MLDLRQNGRGAQAEVTQLVIRKAIYVVAFMIFGLVLDR
jgi:hypothetical protein